MQRPHPKPGSDPDALPPGTAGESPVVAPLSRQPNRSLPTLTTALLLFLTALGSLGAYKKWQSRHQPATPFPLPRETLVATTPPFLVPPPPAPIPGTERVLADTGGAIAEITLHYSLEDEGMLGSFYEDLFAKLPPEVNFKVFCPSEEAIEDFERRWAALAEKADREVALFNVGRTLSLWPRDRRIARQMLDGSPARSFVPSPVAGYEEDKRNDLLITSILWPTGHLPGALLVSFQLEGGNLVVNDDHLFTGINVLDENTEKFGNETELAQALEQVFGMPAFILKDRNHSVPWDHADMYVTPLRDRMMLVADLEAGLRLYKQGQTKPPPGQTSSSSTTLPWDETQVQPEPDAVASLEDIAAQLAALGYEIRRLPALMQDLKEWMLTYNNVLMEHRDGRDIVYLPVYHQPTLDQAAINAYRELGFEVRTVNVSQIYHMGGAIRCLANVTRRQPRSW